MLIYPDGSTEEISGSEERTTNQRMELRAAVEALSRLKPGSTVELYSDSAYLVNAFLQGWLAKWQRNGWQTVKKKEVENRELWEKLAYYNSLHRIYWKKVKGHSNNPYNDRCDELARKAILQQHK